MFFSLPYEYEPAGLYSAGHLILFLVTAFCVALGLVLSRRMDAKRVRGVIRVSTALLWVLEIAKILFVLVVTGSRNPNDFIPLYYCSLALYAGLLSSFGKGLWKKCGDVFLATGGLVGGFLFLIVPNTSLTRYPVFHFISWHSFLLHGLMVYLGLLLLLRGVYRVRAGDIWYCALPVSIVCAAAYLYNLLWDLCHPEAPVANLMFLSKDFPGTPVSLIYRVSGAFFPVVLWLIQAFVPFLVVFAVAKAIGASQKTKIN